MATFCRRLGALILALGLGVAAVAGWLVAVDPEFDKAAEAYARHPDHPLFRTEFWVAGARHYGLLAATVGGLLGGLAVGGMLLALGELLRRIPPREER